MRVFPVFDTPFARYRLGRVMPALHTILLRNCGYRHYRFNEVAIYSKGLNVILSAFAAFLAQFV
jgi:hypothetical protein